MPKFDHAFRGIFRNKVAIIIIGVTLFELSFSSILKDGQKMYLNGEVPKDVFLLLPAGAYPSKDLLKEDFIDGISVRVHWKDIEKSPGKYDWEYLDNIFEVAERENKKVSLRLLGGFWSPSWIYDKGVPYLNVKIQGKGFAAEPFIKKYEENIKLPVVWNEKYLKLWSSFVKAVGERYGSRPNLVLVHLSGPTFFSAEVILARNPEELEKIKAHGFSEKVILRAWEETIETFKIAFPNQTLALNVHFIIKGTNLHVKLVRLAYKLLKTRLAIQGNWLSPEHVFLLNGSGEGKKSEMLRLFYEVQKKGVLIGFQEVWPFCVILEKQRLPISKEEIRKRLFILFQRLQVSYIEIYPKDIKDRFWRKLWESFDSL